LVPARRTKSAVFDSTPDGFVAITMAVDVKPLALVAAICQPGGGVTVRLAVRFVPLTVIDWFVEAFGRTVENPESVVPSPGRMLGEPGALTVPLTATLVVAAPPPVRATLPEKLPADAPMRRTETGIDAIVPATGVSVSDPE